MYYIMFIHMQYIIYNIYIYIQYMQGVTIQWFCIIYPHIYTHVHMHQIDRVLMYGLISCHSVKYPVVHMTRTVWNGTHCLGRLVFYCGRLPLMDNILMVRLNPMI